MPLNKVLIIGNIGRDPEVRYTQDGTAVATFAVAVNEKWQGGEHTEWFSCVAWGKASEIAQKYLKKGSQVCIEGKMRTRAYQGRDGEHRKVTELIVSNIVLLGSKQSAGERSSDQPSYDSTAVTDDNPIGDDDIPF